jgi:predicted transcriptional regulator
LRIVSFKIDKDTLERLDRYALRVGKSRSQIIREAVNEFINKRYPRSKYVITEVGRLE